MLCLPILSLSLRLLAVTNSASALVLLNPPAPNFSSITARGLSFYSNIQSGLLATQRTHPTARLLQVYGGYPILAPNSLEVSTVALSPPDSAASYQSLNTDLLLLFFLTIPNSPDSSSTLQVISSVPGHWSIVPSPSHPPPIHNTKHSAKLALKTLTWSSMIGRTTLDDALHALATADGVFPGIERQIRYYSIFVHPDSGERETLLEGGMYYEFRIVKGFRVEVVYVQIGFAGDGKEKVFVDPERRPGGKDDFGSHPLEFSGSEGDSSRGGDWEGEEDGEGDWIRVPNDEWEDLKDELTMLDRSSGG